MYDFAIVALLGLAAYGVVQLFEEWVSDLDRVHTFSTLALGIVFAFALDYSVFQAWGIGVREDWLGTAGTGLMIGALANVWPGVVGAIGHLTGADAKEHDHGRPRMAA